ncbi:class I SAM-dependent RNA methyltransferase [Actinotignum timonense]|uniref:class I SAM-dependent RNA methyltransferase n=1 Tax=Actinotignum timonense TaxID=1870995 RepID=UPI002A825E06|nr:TRAM domain-containing protein [Actinotignum timonense]MDY5143310.1 TRAM domain-containing protein [Actinotignum timonense]
MTTPAAQAHHSTVDITLEDIGHGGIAIGRAEGKAILARFGLPGEHVRVALTEERARFARGDVIEVLGEPSPYRQAHPWPEAGPGGVGGADLGHVIFDYQHEWKTQVLAATLRRIGGQALSDHLAEQGIIPEVTALESDRASGGWASRTRIDVTVSTGRFGMFREGSREGLPITSMPLAVQEIEELGLWDGSYLTRLARSIGPLREGQRVRILAPSASPVAVSIGGRTFDATGAECSPFAREEVSVGENSYRYRVRASGFWQVHREAPATLIDLVTRAAEVEPGDHILELYAGAGLLTVPLARATGPTGRVESLEGARTAMEDARAKLRGYPWARARTAAISVRNISDADILLADPPRSGLGIAAARAAAASRARRIVLVSCDPAALARDVAAMVESGRSVESMRAVDLFPNTHHFEVVTALR